MGKACSIIVLITESYDAQAKKELDEAIELHIKGLRHWKVEKVSTLEM